MEKAPPIINSNEKTFIFISINKPKINKSITVLKTSWFDFFLFRFVSSSKLSVFLYCILFSNQFLLANWIPHHLIFTKWSTTLLVFFLSISANHKNKIKEEPTHLKLKQIHFYDQSQAFDWMSEENKPYLQEKKSSKEIITTTKNRIDLIT